MLTEVVKFLVGIGKASVYNFRNKASSFALLKEGKFFRMSGSYPLETTGKISGTI